MANAKTGQADPGAAKRRIVEAAADVFARKGYDAAAMREIAAAAGVTKPTIYYYFGSKEGLGHALVKRALGIVESMVLSAVEGPAPVAEKLVAFVDAHFRAARENESLARFIYSLSFAPLESLPGFDFDELLVASSNTLKEVLVEGVAQGRVDPDMVDEAGMMLTGFINIEMQFFLRHGKTLTRADAEEGVRLFLEGVGAKASTT